VIAADTVWATAFHPLDRRSIQEWGGEKVTLPPVLTRAGKFSTEGSTQFDAPLYALRSDRVRVVCIMAPVRGGKTLIADVSIPWAIVNDHASVLNVLQDDKIAPAHAETRAMPTLESVPEIKSMLSTDRHKKRKADVLFANGLPFVITGPALSNLQSRGFKWVVCDEAWMYKPGVLGQAKARLGDFVKMASSKFLVISQGGEEDSDWDFELRACVLFVLHVPCAGCGKHFAPEWTIRRHDNSLAGAVFDTIKNIDGSYDKDASAVTVRYVCEHCGHAHPNTAKTRADWNKGAKYVCTSTGSEFDKDNIPKEVAFRWHALIDYPWDELVKEWLSAQDAKRVGNYEPMINFFRKRCALMRSERSIHDADLPFARVKIENPATKSWPDEVARFFTVDRQAEDTYWGMIRAWSKTGETRRLWYGKLYGEAAIEAKRIEFGVVPDCTVVDSGYLPKGDHGVYAACIRYGWIAAKGTDDPFFWHIIPQPPPKPPLRVMKPWAPLSYGDPGEGTSSQGRVRCKLIRFSSPVMKDRVMGLITHGLWVEPEMETRDEMDKECAKQMAAEFKRPKRDKFTGKEVMVYVCPTGNNHAFDCSAMQVLAAMQLRILPAGVEMEKPNQGENPKGSNA
jgi:ribosomal protein L44E